MELQTCATRWILTLAGREMIPISPFALCSLACLIGIFANLHVRLEAACGAEGKTTWLEIGREITRGLASHGSLNSGTRNVMRASACTWGFLSLGPVRPTLVL